MELWGGARYLSRKWTHHNQLKGEVSIAAVQPRIDTYERGSKTSRL